MFITFQFTCTKGLARLVWPTCNHMSQHVWQFAEWWKCQKLTRTCSKTTSKNW